MTSTPKILMVCTANRCRSPIAAALLARDAATLGLEIQVDSAGLLQSGLPPVLDAEAAAARFGVNLDSHRSRQLNTGLVAQASLVLGMERQHARAAVLASPDGNAFPRTFTLREFIRRASERGARDVGEPLAEWIAGVHAGRTHRDLLGASPADDILDPIGGPPALFEETAAALSDLIRQVISLGWPSARGTSS